MLYILFAYLFLHVYNYETITYYIACCIYSATQVIPAVEDLRSQFDACIRVTMASSSSSAAAASSPGAAAVAGAGAVSIGGGVYVLVDSLADSTIGSGGGGGNNPSDGDLASSSSSYSYSDPLYLFAGLPSRNLKAAQSSSIA